MSKISIDFDLYQWLVSLGLFSSTTLHKHLPNNKYLLDEVSSRQIYNGSKFKQLFSKISVLLSESQPKDFEKYKDSNQTAQKSQNWQMNFQNLYGLGHDMSDELKKGCLSGNEPMINEFIRRSYDLAFQKMNYLFDHPSDISMTEQNSFVQQETKTFHFYDYLLMVIKQNLNIKNQNQLKEIVDPDKQNLAKVFIYGFRGDFSKPIEILTTIKQSKDIKDMKIDVHNKTIIKILNLLKPCFLSDDIRVVQLIYDIFTQIITKKNIFMHDTIQKWFQQENQGLLVLVNSIQKHAQIIHEFLKFLKILTEKQVIKFIIQHIQRIQSPAFNYMFYIQKIIKYLASDSSINEQIQKSHFIRAIVDKNQIAISNKIIGQSPQNYCIELTGVLYRTFYDTIGEQTLQKIIQSLKLCIKSKMHIMIVQGIHNFFHILETMIKVSSPYLLFFYKTTIFTLFEFYEIQLIREQFLSNFKFIFKNYNFLDISIFGEPFLQQLKNDQIQQGQLSILEIEVLFQMVNNPKNQIHHSINQFKLLFKYFQIEFKWTMMLLQMLKTILDSSFQDQTFQQIVLKNCQVALKWLSNHDIRSKFENQQQLKIKYQHEMYILFLELVFDYDMVNDILIQSVKHNHEQVLKKNTHLNSTSFTKLLIRYETFETKNQTKLPKISENSRYNSQLKSNSKFQYSSKSIRSLSYQFEQRQKNFEEKKINFVKMMKSVKEQEQEDKTQKELKKLQLIKQKNKKYKQNPATFISDQIIKVDQKLNVLENFDEILEQDPSISHAIQKYKDFNQFLFSNFNQMKKKYIQDGEEQLLDLQSILKILRISELLKSIKKDEEFKLISKINANLKDYYHENQAYNFQQFESFLVQFSHYYYGNQPNLIEYLSLGQKFAKILLKIFEEHNIKNQKFKILFQSDDLNFESYQDQTKKVVQMTQHSVIPKNVPKNILFAHQIVDSILQDALGIHLYPQTLEISTQTMPYSKQPSNLQTRQITHSQIPKIIEKSQKIILTQNVTEISELKEINTIAQKKIAQHMLAQQEEQKRMEQFKKRGEELKAQVQIIQEEKKKKASQKKKEKSSKDRDVLSARQKNDEERIQMKQKIEIYKKQKQQIKENLERQKQEKQQREKEKFDEQRKQKKEVVQIFKNSQNTQKKEQEKLDGIQSVRKNLNQKVDYSKHYQKTLEKKIDLLKVDSERFQKGVLEEYNHRKRLKLMQEKKYGKNPNQMEINQSVQESLDTLLKDHSKRNKIHYDKEQDDKLIMRKIVKVSQGLEPLNKNHLKVFDNQFQQHIEDDQEMILMDQPVQAQPKQNNQPQNKRDIQNQPNTERSYKQPKTDRSYQQPRENKQDDKEKLIFEEIQRQQRQIDREFTKQIRQIQQEKTQIAKQKNQKAQQQNTEEQSSPNQKQNQPQNQDQKFKRKDRSKHKRGFSSKNDQTEDKNPDNQSLQSYQKQYIDQKKELYQIEQQNKQLKKLEQEQKLQYELEKDQIQRNNEVQEQLKRARQKNLEQQQRLVLEKYKQDKLRQLSKEYSEDKQEQLKEREQLIDEQTRIQKYVIDEDLKKIKKQQEKHLKKQRQPIEQIKQEQNKYIDYIQKNEYDMKDHIHHNKKEIKKNHLKQINDISDIDQNEKNFGKKVMIKSQDRFDLQDSKKKQSNKKQR